MPQLCVYEWSVGTPALSKILRLKMIRKSTLKQCYGDPETNEEMTKYDPQYMQQQSSLVYISSVNIPHT